MATLQETPSANRLHIGVFGKTNSGKSSFINAFTGQEVSIVADVAGTTTDPVYKAIELHPIGPVTIIDTAGFDDESELGSRRVQKTKLAAEKTELAVILLAADEKGEPADIYAQELEWAAYFKKKHTPVLLLLSKTDLAADWKQTKERVEQLTKESVYPICSSDPSGLATVKEALIRKVPENFGSPCITGDLVEDGDLVMLVMPQDIQAPKGRLILPQVQTIRELLDRKCLVMSVTTDKFVNGLSAMSRAPKLIITDSQVFGYVWDHKPKESMLTSFSVLFAAYKGDLPYYIEGAKTIDRLTGDSRVLIAECCTHAPLKEDIGREKIPRMLRKRYGETMKIDHVSGTDYPQDLSGYDLIIQCGGCMFNRKYILSRIDRAKAQRVPMTNYGVTIAHLTGILDKIAYGSGNN